MRVHIKHLLDEMHKYIESLGLENHVRRGLPDYEPGSTIIDTMVFALPRFMDSYEMTCRLRFDFKPMPPGEDRGETEEGKRIKRMFFEYSYPDFMDVQVNHMTRNIRMTQAYIDLCQKVTDFGERVLYLLEKETVQRVYDEYLIDPKPQKPFKWDRWKANDDLFVNLMGYKKERLKEMCRDCDLKVTGNKDDLADRLVEFADEKGNLERLRKYEEWEQKDPESIFNEDGDVAYSKK